MVAAHSVHAESGRRRYCATTAFHKSRPRPRSDQATSALPVALNNHAAHDDLTGGFTRSRSARSVEPAVASSSARPVSRGHLPPRRHRGIPVERDRRVRSVAADAPNDPWYFRFDALSTRQRYSQPASVLKVASMRSGPGARPVPGLADTTAVTVPIMTWLVMPPVTTGELKFAERRRCVCPSLFRPRRLPVLEPRGGPRGK
jgi:hypothetical protein